MKEPGNAVFVKLNEYREILDVLDLIKGKIRDAKDVINTLNDLKNKEDAEIQKWAQSFSDLENKAADIDSLLSQSDEA